MDYPKGLAGITKAHSAVNATPWAFISLALAMMMGTASLPHVMMRYFTTPSVKAARKSVGWSLFFIFLLYSSAPMLATLSKLSNEQADYIGVTPDGPFKPEHYRY